MKGKIVLFVCMAMIGVACTSKEKKMEPALNLANLNTGVEPGTNFYEYACGGWMQANPLKPEFARYGAFDKLREDNQVQVKDLIEDLASQQAPAGSTANKVGTLYNIAMDSAKLNAEKALPIAPYLQEITAIESKETLSLQLAKMFRDGTLPFFNAYVYSDDKNSTINIFHLYQGGYAMGDRDYYLLNDAKTKEIRNKYTQMVEAMFSLSGFATSNPTPGATILDIETVLAKAAYSREQLRDPEANYHKLSVEDLQKQAPAIQWKQFFAGIGLSALEELNVGQPEPIVAASQLLAEKSLDDIKLYLAWNVISNAAGYLSDDFVNLSFDFYGKTLSGKEQLEPRWKRAVNNVNAVLSEALGELYVKKHFPPAAKEKMLDLVEHLKVALSERIDQLPWMATETKAKAQEKLQAFKVKIGYPDKWRDYSNLQIEPDSYWQNIIRAQNFEFDYMISKFNQPVDKNEWLMSPQTVNAYYNPTSNEICFPAAILQPPFFNLYADDAVNYGAIGVVIGHEMTHGFDDQGRMFDKEGNLNPWWTAEDEVNFKARTQVLVDFYNAIEVADSVYANGEFTLGENIADQGGLQVSWQAFSHKLAESKNLEPIDGFSPQQRFFLSYATIWASNIRAEEILRLTKADPHSLAKWRVNGALPHVDAWYEAFSVKEGDEMYLQKEERVFIW